MKSKLSLSIAFLTGIIFAAIIGWNSNAEKNTVKFREISNPDSRPVIAVRKIKLKPNITAETFEKFATRVTNDEFGKFPGVKFSFGKGERGDEIGSYVVFWEFDSRFTRDFYAPSENKKASPEALKFIEDYFNKYDPEFSKVAEVITPAGKEGYTDYLILY